MEQKLFDKEQIENIVLQTIMARPYHEFGGCRIYYVAALGEAAVIKGLEGAKEAQTLLELEEAVNNPDVKTVFIDKMAAITSKGIKSVLSRTSLSKEIFCAFQIKD